MSIEEVIIQDESSGRVHKRYRSEGSKALASHEADNADDAGSYVVLTPAEVEAIEADAFCQRCFPSVTSA